MYGMYIEYHHKHMYFFLCFSELPDPVMKLTVSASTGSGEESCLNVEFSDVPNSLTCVANVVSNLINPPSITLTRDGSEVDSVSDHILIHSLDDISGGEFTCRVCIDVPEAGIADHCNETTLTLQTTGEWYAHSIFRQSSFFSLHSSRTHHSNARCGQYL